MIDYKTYFEKIIENIDNYVKHEQPLYDRPYKVVKNLGSANLLLYNAHNKIHDTPIFIVPSLINKFYILDLLPDNSFIATFNQLGFDVYVIEWNSPIGEEVNYDLEDYVNKRILTFLSVTSEKVNLIGYCMGGIMCLRHLSQLKNHILSLTMLAVPTNFHYVKNRESYNLLNLDGHQPTFPASNISKWFYDQDYYNILNKYYNLNESKEKFELFYAVENWVHDGIDLTLNVADLLFNKWFLSNQIINETFSNFNLPITLIIPTKDKIFPLSCFSDLRKRITHRQVIYMPGGHVGILIGKNKIEKLCNIIKLWLTNLK